MDLASIMEALPITTFGGAIMLILSLVLIISDIFDAFDLLNFIQSINPTNLNMLGNHLIAYAIFLISSIIFGLILGFVIDIIRITSSSENRS